MASALALHRSVRFSPLPTLQNPRPPFKSQLPSTAKIFPPNCFNRLSSSLQIAHGAREISTRMLVRVGGSAGDARSFLSRSFPEAGDEKAEEEALREPSFLEFITSERVKVVAMIALALALCNADRVVMSVAIVPLSLANGWRQSFAGVVQGIRRRQYIDREACLESSDSTNMMAGETNIFVVKSVINVSSIRLVLGCSELVV